MAGDWWRSYFSSAYLDEYSPWFDLVADRAQVARLLEVLALPSGARVLDLACGQGRHAHLLAEAGYNVDGLDYSRELLARARTRGTGRTLRYTQGDMRKLPPRWTARFDGVVNLFTSFGFFDDPADDRRVLAEVARALKPGGRFVWQGGNRDGIGKAFLAGDTWRSKDGARVVQHRTLDQATGVLTVTTKRSWDDRSETRDHRIRLYTAKELTAMLAAVGLTVEARYESFTTRRLTRGAHEMLICASKPIAPRSTRRR